MNARAVCILGLSLLLHSNGTIHAEPPTASITYQGQLKFSGVTVDEPCEFVFKLYDAPAAGSLVAQVGSAATPVILEVQRGLFTVPLDFGVMAFDGNDRWLEIDVRLSSGGVFMTLSPRQPLTAAPSAIHARTGGNYVSSLDESYNKGGPGAGRVIHTDHGPLSLEGPGGLNVAGLIQAGPSGIKFPDGTIQTTAAVDLRGVVVWTDDGTDIWVNDTNALVGIGNSDPQFKLDVTGDINTTGTLHADFISSHSPLELQTSGVTRVYIDDPSGFVGIGTGTDTPDGLLHLGSNDDLSLLIDMDRDGAGNDGFGVIAFGTSAGLFGDLYGDISTDPSFFGVDPPLELNTLSPGDVVLANGGGNVGIGTLAPMELLDVSGNVQMLGFILPTGAADGLVLTSDANGVGTWQVPNANPTGPAGGDLAGTYPNPDIAPDAVDSSNIQDGQVMTADLADNAVNTNKIQDGQVMNADLADNSVNSAKIQDGTVTGDDLANGTIGTDDIADNAITSPKILDGEVMTADLADNSVTSPKIQDGQVMTDDLANDSVTNTKMADNSVGSPEIINDSITADDLASDPMSLNKVTGGVAQSVGGNIDIPAPGKLLVDFISSHSPLELQTGGVTRVYIDDPSGFVGIGTGVAAPETRLQVDMGSEATGASGGYLQLGLQNALNLGLDTDEIQARNNGVANTLLINHDGGNVVIGGGGAGNNVGIGINNPLTTLELQDIQAVSRFFTTNHTNGSVIELWNLTANPAFLGAINFYDAAFNAVGQIGYLGDNQMTFRVNSLERARIDENGRLGIGTTTPLQELHVVGDGFFTGTVFTTMVDSDVTVNPDDLSLKTDGATHIVVQSADGHVGIGSPPPAPAEEALHVAGCVKADCFKVTADDELQVSGLKLIKNGGSPIDLLAGLNGVMTIRPTASGPAYAHVPLDFPSKLLGTEKRLKSVRICYKVATTASFITGTRLRLTGDNGAFTDIDIGADATADRTSRNFDCYTVTPLIPAPITGSLYLTLELQLAGSGSTHDIQIGRIIVTVSEM